MGAKRNPQTAAKRDREQAMRERRERKRLKKQARKDSAPGDAGVTQSPVGQATGSANANILSASILA